MGETYLTVLISVIILLTVSLSVGMACTHGVRLVSLTHTRTALLDVGQSEMEWLRGHPFEQLSDYDLEVGEIRGEVRVEELSSYWKRITLSLYHVRYPASPLYLATDVYADASAL